MEENMVEVDLQERESISKVLDYLNSNLADIAKIASENGGVRYGKISGGEFQEYGEELFEEIPPRSELVFFTEAVKDKDDAQKVQKYVNSIAEMNNAEELWFDDETPMGLNAAFALAFEDKQYVADFINLLRKCDMDHEVYQAAMMAELLKKWGLQDEMIKLLAARSGSITGQFGLEETFYEGGIPIPEFSESQKEKYFKYLMEDSLESKAVFPELLVDAMEYVGIEVSQEKFSALFKMHEPKFNKDNLPKLGDIL